MKSLKGMNVRSFWLLVQKINLNFWVAFLVNPFYFSNIFAADRQSVVIKKEPEETIAIKRESEQILPIKEEPSQEGAQPILSTDTYHYQLWEKTQKAKGLVKREEEVLNFKEILRLLRSLLDPKHNQDSKNQIKEYLDSLLYHCPEEAGSSMHRAMFSLADKDGDVSSVDALVKIEPAWIMYVDSSKWSILHYAACYIPVESVKYKNFLKYLIGKWKEAGLSIDQIGSVTQNQGKITPLMLAILRANLLATETLLEANAQLHSGKENILHAATSVFNNKGFIEFLIKKCNEAKLDLYQRDEDYETPLMRALRRGNLAFIDVFIEAEAKTGIKHLAGMLYWIAMYVEDPTVLRYVVNKLTKKSHGSNLVSINQIDEQFNNDTPLMHAVRHGNLPFIDVLIESEAELTLPNNEGNILHFAAKYPGEQKVTQHLINAMKRKAVKKKSHSPNWMFYINQVDHNGYTPFMIAGLYVNLAAAEALVKAGAELSILTQNKHNALHLAVGAELSILTQNKHNALQLGVVRDQTFFPPYQTFFQPFIRLFQQSKSKQVKAQINQQNQNGCTPLIIALLNGNITAAKELINANAKLNILTPAQNSILHIAVSRIKDKDFLQFLIKKCKDAEISMNQKNQKGSTPLMIAISNNNQEAISELIKAKAELMHPEPNADKSILHFAARYGKDKATVQYLIDEYKAAGLDINPRDQKGYTPLMMAVYKGNKEALEAFIESGATVAVSSGIGNILNFAALHVKDKEVFEHLMHKCLEAGLINIYQANEKSYTPFMVAASSMNLAVIEALMEINAKLNLNIIQENDLHTIAYHVKDKAFIKNFIQKFKKANFSIDTINKNGHTPLMVAVYARNLAAAEALIEENAQLHLLTKENENILHLAAVYVKDKAFMEFLINAFKKAINSIDNSDQEHTSASEYESIKKNLNINLMNQYKETALMVAVLNGNLAAIDALIEGGITLFAPTEDKENIVDFAKRCVDSKKMIEHLRKKCQESNVIDIDPASL